MADSLVTILNTQLDSNFAEPVSKEELSEKLSVFIDDLIRNNIQKLVAILYRVDVSEKKLKQLLEESEGENAAVIIANLIIERQLQKIGTRKKFNGESENDDEEKW